MSATADHPSATDALHPSSKVRQATFIRPAQMSLFARVTCYPPLGEMTCIKRSCITGSLAQDKISFTVILSSSTSFPETPWEVEIWHDILQTGCWTSLPLQKCDQKQNMTMTGNNDLTRNYHHYVYFSELPLPSASGTGKFTVRYRTGPNTEWQWANQTRYTKDGEVVFGPKNRTIQSLMDGEQQFLGSHSPRQEIEEYIQGLSTQLNVEAKRSEAPNALLWSITGSAPPADDQSSGRTQISLGIPTSYLRYFSLVRVWSPWLAPRHGAEKFVLTEDAVLSAFLRSDGLHLVLLAVSGVNDTLTVFGSDEDGDIVAKVRNERTETSQFQVLASVAENFEVCICSLIYEARKVVRVSGVAPDSPVVSALTSEPESPLGDDIVIVGDDARSQWLADWYEGLSYCTWNALGQGLTQAKILEALDTLDAHGIKISNLIIDDNWQSLDNEGQAQWIRGWKSFEANAKGFPSGLRHAISLIKQKHPHISHIAVWHALMGYWGGISPSGELADKYKTKEVMRKDTVASGKMLAIDPDDISRFYNDFYSFLTSAGVDGIKTDAQFYLDLLDSVVDRRRFITPYQDAWTIASLRYFGTRAISCMSMTPQQIFHSHIPTNKPAILLRNSDDFFPDIAESHPWHVFCNAHNNLLTSHLNVIPDWDMFQTSHPYASFHAAARAVSGGPIYITDKPGEHDIDLLNQITAPTTRDTTVILRPSVMGRTVDVYHNYNEKNILRIGTYSGRAQTGSGILGLFNISSVDTSTIVPLDLFPGIDTDTSTLSSNSPQARKSDHARYIIRSHTTGSISDVMTASGARSLVSVSLEPKGWEILTAYPLTAFNVADNAANLLGPSSSSTYIAVLGLIGKMTGVAAIVYSDISFAENRRLKLDVNLKALGVLGIFHSDLESRDIDKHVMVMISGLAVPRNAVWKDQDRVLAIDVLQAWRALKLDAGWSNEVRVQVFIA